MADIVLPIPNLAVKAQLLVLKKTPGTGSRINIMLTLIRIGFFFGDHKLITMHLAKAEDNTLALKRVDLKKKVISAPEVTQVLAGLLILGELMQTLYSCFYAQFFIALGTLEQTFLLPSCVLAPHARYYMGEMRQKAYSQLLESYSSLTIDSLSAAFVVSNEFVDSKLSCFITNGRLHATIHKVHGIVETTRPSLKNPQYETVVKRGDVLLNSVQRLSKVLY